MVRHKQLTLLFLLLPLTLVAVLLFGLPAAVRAGNTAEQAADDLLCRFGVNYASSLENDDPAAYDLTALHAGWYIDYAARMNPWGPPSATYGRVISIGDDRATDTYSYHPDAATIQAVAQANPGGLWFIGNEPDRVDVQNDVRPHIYAVAYHELYTLLKDADPTARVFAGTIVQATPVRLLYLDLILESYRQQFGEPMPVDGWSIHGFILNEVDCDWDNSRCWGADVPPGVDVNYGEILGIQQNDDINLYVERIERFRRWMRDRGYRNKPLSMSEYGVLMPEGYGFDSARVNAFMNATFDYMRTHTDPQLGYPLDGNHLVQNWSWYSVADVQAFNGWLYDPDTKNLSVMGQNYATYTAALTETVDLYPVAIEPAAGAPYSPDDPVTLTVQALIANSGNLVAKTGPVAVRFYDGDPAQGANQIGKTQTVSLAGCGDHATVAVTWLNVSPGAHPVYVVVEPLAEEAATENNVTSQVLLVASERMFLPAIGRALPAP